MNTMDILRFYRDFERYDRQTRDYSADDTKTERFNKYLSNVKIVCTALERLLQCNDIQIIDNESMSLKTNEVKAIKAVIKIHYNTEKRNRYAYY